MSTPPSPLMESKKAEVRVTKAPHSLSSKEMIWLLGHDGYLLMANHHAPFRCTSMREIINPSRILNGRDPILKGTVFDFFVEEH